MNNCGCGGIFGLTAIGTGGPVNNSYNCGDINVKGNTTDSSSVGGISSNNTGTMDNCCNTGKVLSEIETTGTRNISGAITALNFTDCTITNSYYLKGTNANGVETDWGTATVKEVDTLEEMPSILEILGDAFKADTNNINEGYPILSWQ